MQLLIFNLQFRLRRSRVKNNNNNKHKHDTTANVIYDHLQFERKTKVMEDGK